jgi:hypothetical protein
MQAHTRRDFLIMMRPVAALLVAFMPIAVQAQSYGEPLKDGATIAFLGLGFIDSSTEGAYDGERPDQTARLAMLTGYVRDRLAEEGFQILSNEPEAQRLSTITNPANCYGCELRIGTALGADYVVVGEVQKVSNLILSMNLVMRELPEGQMVRGQSVDIRSNTDDSWVRGMRYILNNNFFK